MNTTDVEPDVSSGWWRIGAACPQCATPLTHIAGGTVVAGTSTSVVAQCEDCRSHWQITATLRRATIVQRQGAPR